MMTKIILYTISLVFFSQWSVAQSPPFNISVEPVEIKGLDGLQSFAFGQYNRKWLLIGGRVDGLHRRQPWASFDLDGHNDQLMVIDPVSLQTWSAPLSSLPTSIQDQLSATNMNFYQEKDHLYCIGGYGYSTMEEDHITFPYLTAIKIPEVIDAIIHHTDIRPYFRQIEDPQFQVAGGRLQKIYHVFHLLGGQKFMGRYNPMNHPTFVQEYTNQVRRFILSDDGAKIQIRHLPPFSDAENLHRRDYNAEPQIMPNGEEAITMFSGVFQPDVDLPYLTSVTIDSSTCIHNSAFEQYYNHYHCATVPLYSASQNEMHTVFFGGIAQYYDKSGVLTRDEDVPFVKTIARVTRDKNGIMAEYKLPVEMPEFLGAGSEFILNESIPHYPNQVLDLDKITADKVLIGYIFGGINSSDKNIFWYNDGTQSNASKQIFKVYLVNHKQPGHLLNQKSVSTFAATVHPDFHNGRIKIEYFLQERANVKFSFFDKKEKKIKTIVLKNQPVGANSVTYRMGNISDSQIYSVLISASYDRTPHKVILQ